MLSAVTMIPRSLVKKNAVASLDVVAGGGHYVITKKIFFGIDRFTDCLMLNVVLSADADSVSHTEAVLLNPFHFDSASDQVEQTLAWAHGKPWQSHVNHYGRYWHGYEIPLTLLLTMTDLRGIRVFNGVLYFLFLALALWLLAVKCDVRYSLALLLSLVATGAIVVAPVSMQVFGCQFLMLVGIVAVLLRRRRVEGELHIDVSVFLALGGVTAVIDLLTTPIITLALPLACYIAYHKPRRTLRIALLLSVAWAVGYGTVWASKWVIATAVTGENVIADAMRVASYRSLGTKIYSGDNLTSAQIIALYLNKFTLARVAIIIAVIAIVVGGLRLHARSWHPLTQHLWLLCIGLMPILWYLALAQHSYNHKFFTFRALLVTMFAVTAWILLSLKVRSKN